MRRNLAQNNVITSWFQETPLWSASSPLGMRDGDSRHSLAVSGTLFLLSGKELATQG